jgi:methyltransferase of ATP-grasp peptide maturase system
VISVEEMRHTMLVEMTTAGTLHSVDWIDAFAHVPRELFLRRFFRQSDDLSGWEAVSASDAGALTAIYRDKTWVTQLDNDPGRWELAHESGTPVPGVPTSSSTAPSLMALMLEALDVRESHRVLEIGTGTGYNAAVLCQRLSSAQITTVEVDSTVAHAAAEALRACGYSPTCVTGDGAAGWPGHAPYDRLVATCSVPAVPAEWIAQLRLGGLILTSIHRDLDGGALALLRVDESGRAMGHFLADFGGFMPLRSSPSADAQQRLAAALADRDGPTDARTTSLPADVLDDPHFGMVAALQLPDVVSIDFVPASGPERWLLAGDGSSACAAEVSGTVNQSGPRRLWDELESMHEVWLDAGRPTRARYGLTVDVRGRHRYWLDQPANVIWIDPR